MIGLVYNEIDISIWVGLSLEEKKVYIYPKKFFIM